MGSVHSGRLERWLGSEKVEQISSSMRGWYGDPIPVGNVPGKIYATPDGDFIGSLKGGYFTGLLEFQKLRARRVQRILKQFYRQTKSTSYAGIAGLSDLISQATSVAGARQEWFFLKTISASVANAHASAWRVGPSPAAGNAAAAAPGGTVFDRTSVGALPMQNPPGTDTQHFVSAAIVSSVNGTCYMLYDRLFGVAKTMSSSAAESVTGVPTRYQSTTPGDMDYVGNNFAFPEVGTAALQAVGHNWDDIRYVNQAGNAATAPSIAGQSSAHASRIDFVLNSGWFLPLAAGDTGVKALTQLKMSASTISSPIDWVIGRPIAFMPTYVLRGVAFVDGINTAFNLNRIFNNACLAFLEINRPDTAASTVTGSVTTVYS